MAEDCLDEQLKTVGNLCIIAKLLKADGRPELLPTVLELLFFEAQEIVGDHCISEHQH